MRCLLTFLLCFEEIQRCHGAGARANFVGVVVLMPWELPPQAVVSQKLSEGLLCDREFEGALRASR